MCSWPEVCDPEAEQPEAEEADQQTRRRGRAARLSPRAPAEPRQALDRSAASGGQRLRRDPSRAGVDAGARPAPSCRPIGRLVRRVGRPGQGVDRRFVAPRRRRSGSGIRVVGVDISRWRVVVLGVVDRRPSRPPRLGRRTFAHGSSIGRVIHSAPSGAPCRCCGSDGGRSRHPAAPMPKDQAAHADRDERQRHDLRRRDAEERPVIGAQESRAANRVVPYQMKKTSSRSPGRSRERSR